MKERERDRRGQTEKESERFFWYSQAGNGDIYGEPEKKNREKQQ